MVTKREAAIIEQEMREAEDEAIYGAESLNPALESLYSELGISEGEAAVHIAKLDADGRGEAQIGKFEPDEYDLHAIAKKFGSGSYRIRVYVRIPTGQRVLKINRKMSWLLSDDEEAQRKARAMTYQGVGVLPQPSSPGLTADDVARIVAQSVPRVEPVNPMTMMREVAELMRVMVPPVTSAASSTDPFAMMKNMIEITKLMKGDNDSMPVMGESAGTNDVLLGLINKFGPMFAGMMTQNAAQQMPTQAPQQLAAPMQNPLPQQQIDQPQEQTDVNLKLKMGLMFLVNGCEKGGSPESYAEMIIDNVPAEEMRMLLDAPNVLDVLGQTEPKVLLHREWFGALMAEVKAIMEPEPEPVMSSNAPVQNPVDSPDKTA